MQRHLKNFIDPKRIFKFLLVVFGSLFLLFHVLNLFFPLRVEVEFSTLITDKDGKVIKGFLSPDDKWRMYTPLDEISPLLSKSIIFKEDQYFQKHFGVNPLAISRAIVNNLWKGKRTSGASTLSMQVARMLNPKRRTYFNKLIEMFRAFQLEWKYSKEEILQLYLNLVPYGGNIEGVKSASVLYFDKLPNHLSLAEITALSIIPNRPSSLALGDQNSEIVVERNKWLKRFRKATLFEEEFIEDALEEPLIARRRSGPNWAPHLANRMRFTHREINIKTSIDLRMQQGLEKTAKTYAEGLKTWGIQNCAILVLENKSMKVRAYVGSADFANSQDAGQVDGIRAIRSPGSTLKPLLYALAIDKGMITLKSKIADVPVDYEGYRPQNFHQNHNGLVSVEGALSQSLNIPPVKLMHQFRADSFVQFLASHGFDFIDITKKQLGLSTILGGCGVRLEELSQIYASFPNRGAYRELRFLEEGDDDEEEEAIERDSVWNPGTSFLIHQVLTNVERPDLPSGYQGHFRIPKIAWKTGTSYGRRDAWCIGYNERYTVGVWAGNFSGQGVPELNGAAIATPLLFKVFGIIDPNSPSEWFPAPSDLDFRLVCEESGNVPLESCSNQVMEHYLPGISPANFCQHQKMHFVNPLETISYCRSCLPDLGYKKKFYPNHLPEMLQYFADHSIPYTAIPEHNPACEKVNRGSAPYITQPTNGLDYLIERDSEQELGLRAQVADDVKTVHWYLDNKYLGSCPPHQVFFVAPQRAGRVKISCADDQGRNSDIWVNIDFL